MGRNEDFDNAFWSTTPGEDLSANAALLYIWSWTNPRCGMAGIYEVGRRAMTESKVPAEAMDDALTELADAHLAVYRDGVLWVVARVKRLRTKSVQMAKAVAKDVAGIGEGHPLRTEWLLFYRDASWLRAALTERKVSLTRASSEPQKSLGIEPNPVSLTGASPEVPLTGALDEAVVSVQGEGQRLTRERVDETCTILAAVERWQIDEAGIENALATEPDGDPIRAAHLAATWGSDPDWDMGPAASLRSALRKLAAEKPKQTARERRGAALKNLLASTEGAA